MTPAMSARRRRTIGLLLGSAALAASLPAQPVESTATFELTVSSADFAAPIDHFSAAEEARLAAEIETARLRLYAEGKLTQPDPGIATTFA